MRGLIIAVLVIVTIAVIRTIMEKVSDPYKTIIIIAIILAIAYIANHYIV